MLNQIEFSMNKKSLKELGIEHFHEQFDEGVSSGYL